MTSWLLILGGLIVWTVHFFGIYAIGEIDPRAEWVIALTLVCITADLWLLRWSLTLCGGDHFSVWRRFMATGGIAISLVAIGWQSLAVLAN